MTVQRRPDELIRILRAEFVTKAGGVPGNNTWEEWDQIIVIIANEGGAFVYAPTDAGFASALIKATADDVIYVPPATIAGNHTITTGVEIWGAGREKTIFTGIITLTADSVLNNLSVLTLQNDNNLLNAVIGTSSGSASIHNCTIIATQLDDGIVRAVQQPNGGELFIWYSDIQANGAGSHVPGGGPPWIGWLGRRCYGIYVTSGGAVTHRWCKVSSESQGIDSNPFYDTGATFAVNASLDTGAFDVVAQAGIVIGGLTVGQWYCIENTGGPWDNGDVADHQRYGWCISFDNGTTWHIAEELVVGGSRLVNTPPYCEKSEDVGANHARVYFYAQTTSVKVRVYDVEGSFADNFDSMNWELSSATISFEATESFSVDISNQVGAIITAQRLGERSAYDIDDHAEKHASDIYTDTMLRHLPAPGTDGNIIVDNGGTKWVSTPPANLLVGTRVYNNGNISINDITITTLTFDSERYDYDTIHSIIANTSRLTCNTAGIYQIEGIVQFATNVVGFRQLYLWLNATTYIAIVNMETISTGGTPSRIEISTQYELSVSDYIELRVYQNSGGALNVVFVPNSSPEFMMHRIG